MTKPGNDGPVCSDCLPPGVRVSPRDGGRCAGCGGKFSNSEERHTLSDKEYCQGCAAQEIEKAESPKPFTCRKCNKNDLAADDVISDGELQESKICLTCAEQETAPPLLSMERRFLTWLSKQPVGHEFVSNEVGAAIAAATGSVSALFSSLFRQGRLARRDRLDGKMGYQYRAPEPTAPPLPMPQVIGDYAILTSSSATTPIKQPAIERRHAHKLIAGTVKVGGQDLFYARMAGDTPKEMVFSTESQGTALCEYLVKYASKLGIETVEE